MNNPKTIETKLSNIEKILTEQQEQPMTFKEACKYLNVSSSYLYKSTHKKKIPFYKPGGKMIYFSKRDLDNWIFKNRINSDDELEQAADKYLKGNNIKSS